MLDLLRDSLWQSVGALLALLAIFASFWIYRLQRQRKELAFGAISTRRLLTVADEVSPRITVQLDGRSVRDLHLLVFGLKNSGTVAIRPDDFQRPFCIAFASGEIVSASVSSQRPNDLGATITTTTNVIELAPLLMNANDQILIQVLLSAPTPDYSSNVRLVDIPAISPIELRPRLPPLHHSGIPVFALICLLVALYHLISGGSDPKEALNWMGAAFSIFCFGFVTRVIELIKPSSRRFISEA